MKRRRVITWGMLLVVLAGAIVVVAATRRSNVPAADGDIPIGRVKRGDMQLTVVADRKSVV